MRCKIALTGATGNMGIETIDLLSNLDCVENIKFLCLVSDNKRGSKLLKKFGDKVQIIKGDIADKHICEELVKDVDYVINMAAVIPPKSDKNPVDSERCNYLGAKNMVDSIKELKKQPKLIHISTMAIYGNRNHLHPWGRVGDPLLPSPYDAYAITKLWGERYVLESDLDCWAVIRQTAMLHKRMLADNMSDGLMFHTCYNSVLEWVTARDSGLLIANIIKKDIKENLENKFWKKCFNLGGGAQNRCTGYDTFNEGFKLIGGSTQKFMKPNWNAIRNFHGLFFYDSEVLDDLFNYQTQSIAYYWNEILQSHKYYSLAKLIIPSVISKLAIQPLLNDENAPTKWIDNDDEGRMIAYFGSKEKAKNLPTKWEYFPLIKFGKLPDGSDIDYNQLLDKSKAQLLNHGYDESKKDSELDIEDMKAAAKFRGGKVLSKTMKKGDLYSKLEWQCADGHKFSASPYTVIKAGHWCPDCIPLYVWDFDRLSKSNPYYAQVWYDSHDKDENITYFYDKDFIARFKKY